MSPYGTTRGQWVNVKSSYGYQHVYFAAADDPMSKTASAIILVDNLQVYHYVYHDN